MRRISRLLLQPPTERARCRESTEKASDLKPGGKQGSSGSVNLQRKICESRTMAVSLFQLTAINPGESTHEQIKD
jgi:hypothetical protein